MKCVAHKFIEIVGAATNDATSDATARVGLFLTWAHAYGPTVGLQVTCASLRSETHLIFALLSRPID